MENPNPNPNANQTLTMPNQTLAPWFSLNQIRIQFGQKLTTSHFQIQHHINELLPIYISF